MKLNRKARRARGTWRRPSPTDSPAQQMKAFLKAPGKFHIVQLPDEKSFVVKVTEDEMPIFLTMCQQIRGVLGHCEAIPATPVEAHVADAQEIAQQTAESSRRIREARARQADHETASNPCAKPEPSQVDAAMARHPAGKKRPAGGGRHRAPEPDTTFDRLVAAGPADTDEATKRLAAMEIAAAQQQVATAQDQLEEANQRLRDAYDRGGELHNRAVIEKLAEQAGQAIAEQADDDSAAVVACPLGGECPAGCPGTSDGCRNAARRAAIDEALRQATHDAAT